MTTTRSPLARAATALALLGLCLLLAGCSSREEKLAGYLEKARKFHEAGDYKSEILELRNALQLEPSSPEVNLLVADASLADGNMGNASFYYREAYRLDPSQTRAAMMYAPIVMLDKPEEAEKLIEEVLEKDPKNVLAYMRKTELTMLRNDYDEALRIALTAVNLVPDDPLGYRNLGTAYRAVIRSRRLEKKEVPADLYEKALDSFARAEALEKEKTGFLSWPDTLERARIYEGWPGHQAEATKTLQEAWDMTQSLEAKVAMGKVAAEALNYAAATGDRDLIGWALERRVEAHPGSARAWKRLARFKSLSKDEEEEGAEAVWKQAVETSPDVPEIQASYATSIHLAGRTDEALAYLDALDGEIATDPDIHMARVSILLDAGRLDDATRAIDVFRSQHPAEVRVEIAEARLMMVQGLVVAARAKLRELAGSAERVDVFVLLADAEKACGDSTAALKAISRAIELTDDPAPSMLLTQMSLRAKTGDWRSVLSSFRELQKRNMPLVPAAWAYRIKALYETGQKKEARKALDRALGQLEAPSPTLALVMAEYEKARDPERVRAVLDSAIAANPGVPRLVIERAGLEAPKGKDAVLAYLDAHGADSPGQPLLKVARAQVLVSLGRLKEAETEAFAAFESKQRPIEAPLLLARLLESQRRRPEAIHVLEVTRDGGLITDEQLWLLGRLQMDEGNLDAARDALEDALRRNPNYNVALNDLAYVLAEQGTDLDRALDLARKAREGLPHSAAVADTLGLVYLRRDLARAALVEFDAAVDLAKDPRGPIAEYHFHRGLALEKLERPREALAAFDAALALDPENAQMRDARDRVATVASARADG